jgi:hypothetical protein
MKKIRQGEVAEWTFRAASPCPDQFNKIEFSAVFTDSEGTERLVPGFWAGGDRWKIRYSSRKIGAHKFRTICSDSSETGLHDRKGECEVVEYEKKNPLYLHGGISVAEDRRHFQHEDGTPFFWLGDTWWMGLCKRLAWPDDFQALVANRVAKGFSVIQIVAGLYPDMPWRDLRGANEAGFPWKKDFSCIAPEYFDAADDRIEKLVNAGLVPCIVGCWGYFLPWMGIDKMKRHWRYLVARYGAYPVVWCLAGEAIMPYYLSEQKERDVEFQKKGWTEIARYVKSINSFDRPITIHPTQYGHEMVEDPGLLDFDMLQTGHWSHLSLANTWESLRVARSLEPQMPVLVGEVCYEGIGEACRQEIQRVLFWGSILSGAAGHTYGANGIWQVNTRKKPFGPSPHGRSWGDTPWEDACNLPGGAQLGIAKKILEELEWWKLVPCPESVEPDLSGEYRCSFAAEIPGKLRLIYIPVPSLHGWITRVKNLSRDSRYEVTPVDPTSGKKCPAVQINTDREGTWTLEKAYNLFMPVYQDWLLILKKLS